MCTGWMQSEVVFFCSSKVDLKVQEYSSMIWDSGISLKQGDTCPQGTEKFRVILAVSRGRAGGMAVSEGRFLLS